MNRSIAKFKEQARDHEARESWGEAILAYQKILEIEEEGEGEVELSLFNRIGDLYLRIQNSEEAIRYYELAADRYEEAGLYNGAIALCNKAIRQDPERPEPFLRLTRLALAQGFISEALRSALDFAERTFQTREREAAIGALKQLATYAAKPEIHELLANFLLERDEEGAALAQLIDSYQIRIERGESHEVDELRDQILGIDPDATLPTHSAGLVPGDSEPEEIGPESGWEAETLEEFMEPTADAPIDPDDLGGHPELLAGLESTSLAGPDLETEIGTSLPGIEVETAADSAGIDDLPLLTNLDVPSILDQDETGEDEDEAGAEVGTILDIDTDGIELELISPEEVEVEAEPLPLFQGDGGGEEAGEPGPEPLEWAEEIEPIEPAAEWGGGASGFVDLEALIMDENAAEPGKTRYMVEAPVPTGDEDHDFLELLTQFRSKVEEHLGDEDSASRYDLGLAFKEMGLYDEAIAQFQLALRGADEPLKIYEELGACFTAKGSYTIALRILRRALQSVEGESAELLGIYYDLGRCYEELGLIDDARDAFEQVLALDLEFRDTVTRLAQL